MALTEKQKIAHLLRRFGLGASEAEMEYYGSSGLSRAIDKLINYDKVEQAVEFSPTDIVGDQKNVNMRVIQSWWLIRMVTTRRPLEEKMTLFWHNHFATASAKVDVPGAMYNQNRLLRSLAMGSFLNLTKEVSKDPAMLYWLDNQFNVAGKPNENFAREVMELFTLGIGNYSEKDVQEAARCFTGWTYGRGRRAIDKPRGGATFTFREDLHDSGVKTVLKNTGKFNGDDIVGILVGHPQTSKFIAKKMWEWFAYLDPAPALVDRLAGSFRESGFMISRLVRDIMESPEFYSDKCVRHGYKNPIDYCVATYRQMGFGTQLIGPLQGNTQEDAKKKQVAILVGPLLKSTTAMGMELLNPPDVSGWFVGPKWISSATMVERIKWADHIVQRSRLAQTPIYDQADTSAAKVESLCSRFDIELPASKKSVLTKAFDDRAGDVEILRLVFGTPEFQFL